MITTTLPIVWIPVSATSFALTNTADTPPAFGDWVEIIASASADLALAGIGLIDIWANAMIAFEIGTGALGAEVVVGRFILGGPNSGDSGGQGVYYFNAALDVIPSGSRVSLRARTSNVAGTSGAGSAIAVFVGYYEAPDAVSLPHRTEVPRLFAPDAASGVIVTPNAGSGVNSIWFEITAGFVSDIWAVDVAAVANSPSAITGDYEIDLGTGAAASEVVIATFTGKLGEGTLKDHQLPTLRFIAAGTRIAVRLRKDGTDVANWAMALNYHMPAVSSIINELSGIYKIVPGDMKRNDTLYTSISPVTTEDRKIPDPYYKTAYVGE